MNIAIVDSGLDGLKLKGLCVSRCLMNSLTDEQAAFGVSMYNILRDSSTYEPVLNQSLACSSFSNTCERLTITSPTICRLNWRSSKRSHASDTVFEPESIKLSLQDEPQVNGRTAARPDGGGDRAFSDRPPGPR